MAIIVTKFGGSSLADAEQIKKVKRIVELDPSRKYVVPSAPGKRFKDDRKVTDMMYALHKGVSEGEDVTDVFEQIKKRYVDIKKGLELSFDIESHIDKVYQDLKNGESREYAASRGEYLNGMLIASYLGIEFIDSAEVIFFDNRGRYDEEKTIAILSERLKKTDRAVIPGFYGSDANGKVVTFSRGGSDVTGAIVAAAAGADKYENWTDVSGFYTADPRVVPHAKKIDYVTYKELRELAYMGASVLHEDAIFPVYRAKIPINVRNTNEPDNPGTMVLPSMYGIDTSADPIITGIAGKKDFTVITVEKNGMNSELGFGRKILACIEKYSVPFEHMPSSIDTLSVVLEDSKLRGNLDDIVEDIKRVSAPDSIEVVGNMALIATVGRGMRRSVGCSGKLFGALAKANINIRMIDKGSDEMNIIIGVENDDFERALIAIHDEFMLDA